jgi:hypothetical protein
MCLEASDCVGGFTAGADGGKEVEDLGLGTGV